MRTLLILRHAKSSWENSHLDDHDRPLNPRGLRDAPRMGRLLLEESLLPDRILSSSALRAISTAMLVAESADCAERVETMPRLYLADPESYASILRLLPDKVQTAMVVGHNPGVEDLVGCLTGRRETMPTAALARVELPIDRWEALELDDSGELIELWRPKQLKASR